VGRGSPSESVRGTSHRDGHGRSLRSGGLRTIGSGLVDSDMTVTAAAEDSILRVSRSTGPCQRHDCRPGPRCGRRQGRLRVRRVQAQARLGRGHLSAPTTRRLPGRPSDVTSDSKPALPLSSHRCGQHPARQGAWRRPVTRAHCQCQCPRVGPGPGPRLARRGAAAQAARRGLAQTGRSNRLS
jgi:hypothetical protein